MPRPAGRRRKNPARRIGRRLEGLAQPRCLMRDARKQPRQSGYDQRDRGNRERYPQNPMRLFEFCEMLDLFRVPTLACGFGVGLAPFVCCLALSLAFCIRRFSFGVAAVACQFGLGMNIGGLPLVSQSAQ